MCWQKPLAFTSRPPLAPKEPQTEGWHTSPGEEILWVFPTQSIVTWYFTKQFNHESKVVWKWGTSGEKGEDRKSQGNSLREDEMVREMENSRVEQCIRNNGWRQTSDEKLTYALVRIPPPPPPNTFKSYCKNVNTCRPFTFIYANKSWKLNQVEKSIINNNKSWSGVLKSINNKTAAGSQISKNPINTKSEVEY